TAPNPDTVFATATAAAAPETAFKKTLREPPPISAPYLLKRFGKANHSSAYPTVSATKFRANFRFGFQSRIYFYGNDPTGTPMRIRLRILLASQPKQDFWSQKLTDNRTPR